jgi:diguanylate cyclase (GGDEF)-like protein
MTDRPAELSRDDPSKVTRRRIDQTNLLAPPSPAAPAAIVAAADAAVADVAAASSTALGDNKPAAQPSRASVASDGSAADVAAASRQRSGLVASESAGRALGRTIGALAGLLLAAGACLTIVLALTREPAIGIAAAAFGVAAAWLAGLARRVAVGGRLGTAVIATAAGLTVLAVAVGALLPAAIVGLIALPLMAVALALPYSDRFTVAGVMIAALVAEGLLALEAELLPTVTNLTVESLAVLRSTAFVVGIALVMVLLWQFARRLDEVLARMAAGTVVLRDAETRIVEVNEDLRHRVDELEVRSRETAQLTKLGDLLQSCETADEAYRVITRMAGPLFAGDGAVLYELTENRTAVEQVAAWGETSSSSSVFAPTECWALRRGRPYLVEDSSAELLCPHIGDLAPPGYLCVPLAAQSETLGLLCVEISPKVPRQRRAAHLVERQRLAVTLSEHLSLALANFRLRATLRERSTRDELTGLFNRRYMEDTLDREIRRSIRDQLPLGVLMIDLDHFKRLNDAFGHAAGDYALRLVGEFLLANVRSEDIACRFGGEEFVVILPKANTEETRRRAETIRLGSQNLQPEHGGPVFSSLTMSIGVAAYPEHAATGEGVLRAADEALYRAKALGRDRVVVAGGREGSALPVGTD